MPQHRDAAWRRRRPRGRITAGAAALIPWCAALGFLVSFAADAGQETRLNASQAWRRPAAAAPADLVPLAGADFGFRLPPADPVLRQARLVIGDPADFLLDADEVEPKPTLKPQAGAPPAVDRTHKADPAVELRPGFDARLRQPGSLATEQRAAAVFAGDDPAARPMEFATVEGPAPGPDSVSQFEPMPAGTSLTTMPTTAAASPAQPHSATTPSGGDGATPAVSRAQSLASTTPAPADATPIEIAALPKFSRGPGGIATGNRTVVGITPARPDYAALIDAAKTTSEQRCLATAIYFEARSEPEQGQAAVAQVILNRVGSGLYPASVCGVVFQNQQHRNACQFSFACEGRALRITDPASWSTAVRVAREVTEGIAYVSDVGGATHYHANYVRPFWAARLKKTDRIGHHIFYTLRPGQT